MRVYASFRLALTRQPIHLHHTKVGEELSRTNAQLGIASSGVAMTALESLAEQPADACLSERLLALPAPKRNRGAAADAVHDDEDTARIHAALYSPHAYRTLGCTCVTWNGSIASLSAARKRQCTERKLRGMNWYAQRSAAGKSTPSLPHPSFNL